MIGERWGLCDPTNPKNRRRRASILMELGTTAVLVDTGPDLRDQINDLQRGEGHVKLNAVLYTHEHADHVAGIDDMRFLSYGQNGKVPAFAKSRCRQELWRRFDYIFEARKGTKLTYPSIMTLHDWPDHLELGGMVIETWEQEHGDITSQGIRVGDFAYSTDVSDLTPQALKNLRGLHTWIVGCIRKDPHPGHAHLNKVLTWAEQVQPRHVFLTHMTGLIDYDTWNTQMPDHINCAYDGQVLEIPF